MDIPDPILSFLEQSRPAVKLHINTHRRLESNLSHVEMPLIQSLCFLITHKLAREYDRQSRMAQLKEILLHVPNLRKLEIELARYWRDRRIGNHHGLRLPLNPSDRLPSLHELIISGSPGLYEFDLQHCRLLGQCADWSLLRRLDLGHSCSQYLFDELGPRLHRLRSLTIGIRLGTTRISRWCREPVDLDSLDPVIRFIRSVAGLHELRVWDQNCNARKMIAVIIESQRSLQRLSYRLVNPPHRFSKNLKEWTTSQLLDLRDNCPDLSSLQLYAPLLDQTQVG